MDAEENAVRTFPETFQSELSAILAGARNGGTISPRRRRGLLVELERAKRKYDDKIATIRARATSPTLDEAERTIENTAADFVAALPADKAA